MKHKIKHKHFSRHIWNAFDGCKVSRKTKKLLIGKKKTVKRIQEMIFEYKFKSSSEEKFCPSCGCETSWPKNHYVGYPDIWIEYFCMRCGRKVAEEDNSPYKHILDENSLDILLLIPMAYFNYRGRK